MTYFTSCKICGEQESRLRPVSVQRKDGTVIYLKYSDRTKVLEACGIGIEIYSSEDGRALKTEEGDSIGLSCSYCGANSDLEDYKVPDPDKIATPDVEALRNDINSMLDTARFAPRPPVYEAKKIDENICKACNDTCGCSDSGEDDYCSCNGCDGCNACSCCCTCNDDDDEPTEDPDEGVDPPENHIAQREVRAMEETRFMRLRDNLSMALQRPIDREGTFYTIIDWENTRHWNMTDPTRISEKFLDLQSAEAELFVENLHEEEKVRIAAWRDRVFHIE